MSDRVHDYVLVLLGAVIGGVVGVGGSVATHALTKDPPPTPPRPPTPPTSVVRFVAPNGSETGSGIVMRTQAFGRCTRRTSEANPGNPDARLCVEKGGRVRDPCFPAPPQIYGAEKGTVHFCFEQPWGGEPDQTEAAVVVSRSTLTHKPIAGGVKQPWALELESGVRCLRQPRPTLRATPPHATYECNRPSWWILGFPNQKRKVWSAQLTTPGTLSTRDVRIVKAWY